MSETTTIPMRDCDLGPIIKAAMGLRRWTQTRLADEAGLTQSGVSDIIRRGWGHRPSVQAICEALDISWTATLVLPQDGAASAKVGTDRA